METHEESKGWGKWGRRGEEGLKPNGNNNRRGLLRLPPVQRFTLEKTSPDVAGSFRNHPQRLRSKGQRHGGGVRGVRLTVPQRSPDLGGLWVAEWSTWRTAASPF